MDILSKPICGLMLHVLCVVLYSSTESFSYLHHAVKYTLVTSDNTSAEVLQIGSRTRESNFGLLQRGQGESSHLLQLFITLHFFGSPMSYGIASAAAQGFFGLPNRHHHRYLYFSCNQFIPTLCRTAGSPTTLPNCTSNSGAFHTLATAFHLCNYCSGERKSTYFATITIFCNDGNLILIRTLCHCTQLQLFEPTFCIFDTFSCMIYINSMASQKLRFQNFNHTLRLQILLFELFACHHSRF